jgi:hypothetical protein
VEGEFYVRRRAALTDDPQVRAQAIAAASYTPKERYILFQLTVESAFMNIYGLGMQRWSAPLAAP